MGDPFDLTTTFKSFHDFMCHVQINVDWLPASKWDCPDCGKPFAWCECPECNQVGREVAEVYKALTKLEEVSNGWARVRPDGIVLRRAYTLLDRRQAVTL